MTSNSHSGHEQSEMSGADTPGQTARPDDSGYAGNVDGRRGRVTHERLSSSPSRFIEQEFEKFKKEVENYGHVENMAGTRPIRMIEGEHAEYYQAGGVLFNHIEPFSNDITDAKPDAYDGIEPQAIDRSVREDLDKMILPNHDINLPALPNFFLETKGPSGKANVVTSAAALNGAIGARAMHSLQNYGRDEPIYDGKAYAFTNTYVDGTLKMYTAHVTLSPITGLPRYHMTMLNTFAMDSNAKTFREGVTCYRNARDLAAEYRWAMVKQANEVARLKAEKQVSSVSIIDS